MNVGRRAFLVCSVLLVLAGAAIADSGANHQVPNPHFGVSGGNIQDMSRAFCCSGTLGSLVTNGYPEQQPCAGPR